MRRCPVADIYKPGEIVDIAIKGVRVLDQRRDGTVVVRCDDNSPDGWRMPPQAAIVRVAPAEWPPRKGDLWRDCEGELWLAFPYGFGGGEIRLTAGIGDTVTADWVLVEYGPLTLVHRESAAEAETADAR